MNLLLACVSRGSGRNVEYHPIIWVGASLKVVVIQCVSAYF